MEYLQGRELAGPFAQTCKHGVPLSTAMALHTSALPASKFGSCRPRILSYGVAAKCGVLV